MVNELFTSPCTCCRSRRPRFEGSVWWRIAMDISGVGAAGGMHAVSGASSSGPPQQKMSSLFDAIDTSGSGSITQSQFDQAFQSKNPPSVFQKQGADAIFAALDPNGTGSVSKQDFVAAALDPNGTGSVSKQDFVAVMSKLMASLRAGNTGQSGSQSQDSLAASLQALNQIDPASAPQNAQPGSLINLQA